MLIYTYPADTAIVYPGIGGAPTPPPPGSTQVVEIRILSLTNETNKELPLLNTPYVDSEVIVMVQGAPSQVNFQDYQVVGDLLQWGGLGLDGLLEAGDSLTILYWI